MKRLLVAVTLFLSFGVLLPASALADVNASPGTYHDGGGAVGSGGCTRQPCGGGGGGAVVWFDIDNLDNETINWGTLDGQLNGTYGSLEAYRQAIINKYLTADQAAARLSDSNVSVFNQLVWKNTCFSGNAGSYNPPNGSTNVTACKASSSGSGFGYWNEFHTSSPDGDGPPPVLNQLVGWNIQVWREDSQAPIFQRRIGLATAGNGDDDPQGRTNTQWWFGGSATAPAAPCSSSSGYTNARGGRFSGCRRAQGPLALITQNLDHPNCLKNLSRARRTFTGVENVYGNTVKPYNNGAWTKQLASNSCYWNVGGQNSGEAINITWSVNPGSGKGSIRYTIQGKPGFFYAVHITAMDGREQLISGLRFKPQYLRGQNNNNYFRVFIANLNQVCVGAACGKVACTPGVDYDPPDCPGTPNGSSTDAPKLDVVTTRDNPIPTRLEGTGTVSTYPLGGLSETQAVHPWLVQLIHFTPQWRYDGARGTAPYSSEYVRYDSLSGIAPAQVGSPTPVPMKMAVLKQPAEITLPPSLDPNSDSNEISVNDFGISWMRPTLENPCPTQIQQDDDASTQKGAWPGAAAARRCDTGGGVVPRDVWDDYLEASVIYESRWVGGGSNDMPLGWVQDQALRCKGSVGSGQRAVAGCPARHTFEVFNGTARDRTGQTIGQTQHVQGYVRPSRIGRDLYNNRGAAIGIKLTTNRPDLLQDIGGSPVHIWDRNTSQEQEADGSLYIEKPFRATYPNTVLKFEQSPTSYGQLSSHSFTYQGQGATNNPQLWFCTNGVPATANLDRGVKTSAADDKTSAVVNGDATNQFVYRKVINDAVDSAGVTSDPRDGCGGYTSAWKYAEQKADNSPDTWDTDWYTPWRSCSYNTAAPTLNNYLNNPNKYVIGGFPGYPNDASYASLASSWGRYDEDETWKIGSRSSGTPLDGSSKDMEDAIRARVLRNGGEVPYDGQRPGRPSLDGANTFSEGCYKHIGDGRYYDGSWQKGRTEAIYASVKFYRWEWRSGDRRSDGSQPVNSCTRNVTQRSQTNYNSSPNPGRDAGPDPFLIQNWGCETSQGLLGRYRLGDWIYVRTDTIQTGTRQYWQWQWMQTAANCHPQRANPDNVPSNLTPYVSQPSQTTYSRKSPPGPADPNLDPFSPGSWYCTRDIGKGNSFVQKGQWKLGRAPGPGWGKNQNGPNLPDGAGYTVQWTFGGMPARVGTWWELRSSYRGHVAWNWMTWTRLSDVTDSPEAGKTVAAYGTRTTR